MHLLNSILANFYDLRFKCAVLSFHQQQRTTGSLGSQWGWEDDDDDDVSAFDVPEVEYKVSDQISSSFAFLRFSTQCYGIIPGHSCYLFVFPLFC